MKIARSGSHTPIFPDLIRNSGEWAHANIGVTSFPARACGATDSRMVSTTFIPWRGLYNATMMPGACLEDDGNQSACHRRQGNYEPGRPFPECQQAERGYAQGKVSWGLYGGRPDRVV